MASDNTVKRLRALAYQDGLKDAAQVCAKEAAYWRDAEVDDGTSIGAVGAASNCCAAILKLERKYD